MTLCSQAVKTATTDDEPTDERNHRALDLDNARAVSIDGATLIECDAYTRTDDGAALRFDGSEPLFVVGLCSERKARDALAEAGYAADAVDRAFELGEWMEETRPERATAAIRTAERDEVRAMADGDQLVESTDGELPTIETVEQFDDGTPRYCRCEGCGASGPSAAGLDDRGPVILHERSCPHAEDSR